jgi:hypothetical protein
VKLQSTILLLGPFDNTNLYYDNVSANFSIIVYQFGFEYNVDTIRKESGT